MIIHAGGRELYAQNISILILSHLSLPLEMQTSVSLKRDAYDCELHFLLGHTGTKDKATLF